VLNKLSKKLAAKEAGVCATGVIAEKEFLRESDGAAEEERDGGSFSGNPEDTRDIDVVLPDSINPDFNRLEYDDTEEAVLSSYLAFRYPTREEQKILVEAIKRGKAPDADAKAKARAKQAQDKLINGTMQHIIRQAGYYNRNRRFSSHVSLFDLAHEAIEYVMRRLDKFDPDKGDFAAFVTGKRIPGINMTQLEVQFSRIITAKSYANGAKLPVDIFSRSSRLNSTIRDLTEESNGNVPSIEEIADRFRAERSTVDGLIKLKNGLMRTVSIDGPASQHDDRELRDFLGCEEDILEKINLRDVELSIKSLIRKAVEKYNRYELKKHRQASRITPLKEFVFIQFLIEKRSYKEIRNMVEEKFGYRFNSRQYVEFIAWEVAGKLKTKVKNNSLKPILDFKKVEEEMGVPGLFGKISLKHNNGNGKKTVSSSPLYFRGLRPLKHFNSQAPPASLFFGAVVKTFSKSIIYTGSSPITYSKILIPQLSSSDRKTIHIYESIIISRERIDHALRLLGSLRFEFYRQTGLSEHKNSEYLAVLTELKAVLGRMRGTKNKIAEAHEITLVRQELELISESLKNGIREGLTDNICQAVDLLEARKERLGLKMKRVEKRVKKILPKLILLEPQVPYDNLLIKKPSVIVRSSLKLETNLSGEIKYRFYGQTAKRFQKSIKEGIAGLLESRSGISTVEVFYADHKPGWKPQNRQELIQWLAKYYPGDNTFGTKEEPQLRAIYYNVIRRTYFDVFVNRDITFKLCRVKVTESRDRRVKVEVENLSSSPINSRVVTVGLLNVLKVIKSRKTRAIFSSEHSNIEEIARQVGLEQYAVKQEVARVCRVLEEKFNMFLDFEDIKEMYLAAQMLLNPELATRRNIQLVSGCISQIYNSTLAKEEERQEAPMSLAELVDEYDEISKSGWEGNGKGTYAVIYRDYRRYIADIVGRGKSILSNGCGTGELEELLLAQGNRVSGLDISPGMINAFKLRCPSGEAILANANIDLPRLFKKETFDVIIFPESIGHMDIPVVTGESYRLLREGGILIITTYEPLNPPAGQLFKSYKKLHPALLAKIVEDERFRVIKKEVVPFEDAEDSRYYMPGGAVIIVGLKDKTQEASSPIKPSLRITSLGGGSGPRKLTKGLISRGAYLYNIITVFDNGFSTGVLRRYFDIPAFGDLRNR
ncbi:MAG: methyltransferase domain-containing protein, partial [Candidatus Omnitrophica bacterium]|nr:methyltransferase domain-containing protein [Candidatus Omnitrophota bacterium]